MLREPGRRRRDEERLFAPNKEPVTNQKELLTRKAPYKFESSPLQRRVRCELDLGEGGFTAEIAAAPPCSHEDWARRNPPARPRRRASRRAALYRPALVINDVVGIALRITRRLRARICRCRFCHPVALARHVRSELCHRPPDQPPRVDADHAHRRHATAAVQPEREMAAAATSRFNGCICCASVHARHSATYSKRADDSAVSKGQRAGAMVPGPHCRSPCRHAQNDDRRTRAQTAHRTLALCHHWRDIGGRRLTSSGLKGVTGTSITTELFGARAGFRRTAELTI